MNPFKLNETGPQFAETFLTRTALGVMLMAIAYSASAAIFLVNEGIGLWLDRAELILALTAVALVLPMFIRLIRMRGAVRADCEPEGFVAEVFRKACVKAFSLTFVVLVVLEPLSENILGDLPAPFFLNLTLAASLAIFSITFFSLSHHNDDHDDDEFDDRSEEEAGA